MIIAPRIKVKNRGRYVYRDTSSRGKGRKRHDCWRAEINEITPGGIKRLRRRFKDKKDAYKWIGL